MEFQNTNFFQIPFYIVIYIFILLLLLLDEICITGILKNKT